MSNSDLATSLAERYRIGRELGSGGMATVYLARDLKHDRDVAIKVLHPDLAESLGSERFLREIRLAAGLTHPHILPPFDSGDSGGRMYYVMPSAEGDSLRDRLDEVGQLSVNDALRIASEVADALDYAHRVGVVHRDISPGQTAGDTIDGRSDLFALGCMLYQMLTGEQPFTGSTIQATIAKRFHHTPPTVGAKRAGLSPALSATVERLLEKDPDARFATGTLVVTALRSSSGQSPVVAPHEAGQSVTVLPFTNLSASADDASFADGITEEIINVLASVPGLRVAARTSCFALKGKNEDLRTIGERLGVRHVLEGSVRKAGTRRRITGSVHAALG